MQAITTTPVYSTDYYMSLLSALSNVQKLDIISRLSASLVKKEKKKKKDLWREFMEAEHADWGGDMPVEEYAASLRNQTPVQREFDTW